MTTDWPFPTPPPLIGGSRAYCEHTRHVKGGIERCMWRRRLKRRGLAKYRQHYRRHHAADWSLPDTDVAADLAAVSG